MACAAENACLRFAIRRKGTVTVDVIGGDVEHDGNGRRESLDQIELETRQLQNIGLGFRRLDQIQSGRAEIGTGTHATPGRFENAPDERRHRALAVRTRHGRERRACMPGKDLDVPDDTRAARARADQSRLVERHPGAHCNLRIVVEARRGQRAAVDLDTERARSVAVRWRRAGVERRDVSAARGQKARTGQARRAEAEHGPACAGYRGGSTATGGDGVHQRSFRVARPASTSTTVMIQKRTITRGSGQPFSSK